MLNSNKINRLSIVFITAALVSLGANASRTEASPEDFKASASSSTASTSAPPECKKKRPDVIIKHERSAGILTEGRLIAVFPHDQENWLAYLEYIGNDIVQYHNLTLPEAKIKGPLPRADVDQPIPGLGSLLLEEFLAFKAPVLATGGEIRVPCATGSFGHYVSQGFLPRRYEQPQLRAVFVKHPELRNFCMGTGTFEALPKNLQAIFDEQRTRRAKRAGVADKSLSRADVCRVNVRAETEERVLDYLLMTTPTIEVDDLFVDQDAFLEFVPSLRETLKKRRSMTCVLW